ncbi:MAG: hypothetical protein AMS26_11975 [Bacteroides sp. SM23_62]|nr:MAG: hypothetical protein AMS26_11975 [Bacteroides sp. SM23_62]
MGLGLGAVALATSSGAAISVAQTAKQPFPREENRLPELSTFNKYGDELETSLLLRTSPIAVKMLEKEADIPKEAFRPKRDGGYHIAQCQAFGMSRREGKTVAMLKEDHWCPTALMAYGMVEKPASMASWAESFMSFEVGKYIGVLTAPLKNATFMPDVVLIYLNPAQLRGLVLPMTFGGDPSQVITHLFLPSCGHAVVDPMKTRKYCVVLPDPGEYQRALAAEDEMIFAVPREKMEGLMAGLKGMGRIYSHRDQYMSMHPDFEQPQFYKDLFKSWGLDSE